MKRQFLITESDRQNILSMYGLLTEGELTNVKITGRILDEQDVPYPNENIILLDNNNKPITNTSSDDDGNFTLSIPKINSGDYKLKFSYSNITKPIKIVTTEINVGDVKPGESNVEVKQVEEVVVSKLKLTTLNINFNKPLGEDVKYNITTDDGKTLLYVSNDNQPKQLSFLKTGQVYQDLPDTFPPEIINDFFDDKGQTGTTKNIKINIYKKDKRKPFHIQTYEIKLSNYSVSVKLTKSGDKIISYEKSKEDIKILFGNKENNINIVIPDKNLIVKDQDDTPLNNVEINVINSKGGGGVLKTDENGVLELNGINVGDNLIIKKEGYKTKQYVIKNIDEDITIFLERKVESQSIDVAEELPKKFKNTLFTIYGKGTSDISKADAERNAKNNIIEQYVETHKNYQSLNLEQVKSTYLDIDFKLEYSRPPKLVTKNKGQYLIYVSAKKRDVRQFLNTFAKQNNIKIEQPPFEFENLPLVDALKEGFVSGRNVLVVVGGNDKDTSDVIKKLKSNKEINNDIDKKYIPLYITRSNDDTNYRYLENQLNNFRTSVQYHPRVVLLKPKNKNGEVGSYEFKDEILNT